MSAIFGVYFRDGRPADSTYVGRMSERLAHRGPDGSGVWCHGSVGFGQRILRTTTESFTENWPFVEAHGDQVLVADARIDNREELITELDLRSPSPVGISDGKLILSAYRRWGRSAPERLIGDFAFALWDGQRRSLFCARDPMGVKPFYYCVSDRLFAFASEIKGLFCLPGIPREVDELQVASFLDLFVEDPVRTFYRDISRLPAAHFLDVSPDRMLVHQYWAPDPAREIHYSTSEQYVEAFKELFTQAVACRLRSAFPIGAALSGGLDSSSVVCTARQMLQRDQPLNTFSSVFPGLPDAERQWNDESHYIDIVTAGEGIVSHRVRADQLGPLAELDNVLWHHDAPPLGFNLYMRWAIYRAAHEEGIRVFLNGDDGDSVVSHGYERFLDLALEERWQKLTSEVAALGGRRQVPPRVFLNMLVYPYLIHLARTGRWGSWMRGTREIARSLHHSRRKLMLRYGIGAFVPECLIEGWRAARLGGRDTSTLRPLSPEFARRVGLEKRKRELKVDDPEWMLSARRAHALSFPSAVHQYGLELTDSAAGAFGIEPRYPFFDRRLVEFCVALPTEQKLAEGWTRLVHRRAMEGVLPTDVQWRNHKGDLSFNFTRRLRETDREELEATLFDEPSVLDEYLDMSVLRSIYRRFLAGGSRIQSKQDGAFLYLAAVLARWLRGSAHRRPQPRPEPADMMQEASR